MLEIVLFTLIPVFPVRDFLQMSGNFWRFTFRNEALISSECGALAHQVVGITVGCTGSWSFSLERTPPVSCLEKTSPAAGVLEPNGGTELGREEVSSVSR